MIVCSQKIRGFSLFLLASLMPIMGHAASTMCPDEGLTYRAVSCIRNVFFEAVRQMMPFFENLAGDIMTACITLAFGILGFRTILGQTQDATGFGKDFVWLLLKVAAVVFLVTNFDNYYDDVVNGTDELLYVVISPLNTSVLGNSCPLPASTSQAALIWARVDCMLGAVLGFGLMSGGVFLGIGEGIRAGFGSTANDNAVMSAVGPIIAITGITMFFGILLSFFRAVYLFLVTYLGLSMCFLIAPIMFPLMLFRYTMQMFASWVQAILGFILQPVLVMAVISMMIMAMDKAFFTDVGSLAYVMGNGFTVCNISPADGSSCTVAPASTGAATGNCRYDNFQHIMNHARACGVITTCDMPVGGVNMESRSFENCLLRNNQTPNEPGVNSAAMANVTSGQWQQLTATGVIDQTICNPELMRVLNPFQATASGFINFSTNVSCFANANPIELLGAFLTTAVLCLIFYIMVKELPQTVGTMTTNLPLIGVRRIGSLSESSVPFEGAFKSGASAMTGDMTTQPFGNQSVESFQRGFMSGLFR